MVEVRRQKVPGRHFGEGRCNAGRPSRDLQYYLEQLSSVEGRKETVETVETLWTDVM